MKKILALILTLCIITIPVVYADDVEEELIEEEEIIEEEILPEEEMGDIETTNTEESVWNEYKDVETEISTTPISVPDGITVMLDGEVVVFDAAQPALINNRTMVPMRKIFEALGAEVTWDNATQTAKAVKGDMTVEITIGSNTMYSSGTPVEIDSPALLLRSRTYVPVRFISNALGAKVDWDNAKQIVYLTTK